MRVLQFVSFLALYVWQNEARADEQSYISAYLKEPISTCEVRNLSQYWNMDTRETKIAIGKQLLEKKELLPIIQEANKKARKKGVQDCDFWSLDFSYEDADLMSTVWGIDTYEAKMKLANIAAQKSFAVAQALVQKHKAKNKTTEHENPYLTDPNSTSKKKSPDDAFFSSQYDWCHAKMLSKAYGLNSVYEAKVWMGEILLSGDIGLLQAKMGFAQGQAEANPQNRCAFEETRFSYNDAEKLAKLWSIPVAEAKATLQNKYLYGLEFQLEERLRR